MDPTQQYCLRWNNHEQNLLETMAEQFQNQIFTDVTLSVVDAPSVHCHKMILAASSQYFSLIFAEYPPDEHLTFVLRDVKYKEIMAILEYMYKGEINVPGSDLPALFEAAENLKIKGLIGGNKEFPISGMNDQRVKTADCSEKAVEERSSLPHSTSSPCYSNAKTSVKIEDVAAKLSLPPWPFSLGLPVEGHNPIAAAAALQSSLSARYSSLLGSSYDNGTKAVPPRKRRRKMSSSGITMNRSEPILRTALNQGQGDSPHGIPNLHHINRYDTHYRSHSNGSANNESDDKQSSMDAFNSHATQSPYESETSMVDEDDNKIFRTSFSRDTNSDKEYSDAAQKQRTANCYKKYTPEQLSEAIAAVLYGNLTPNKAAKEFKVPSRTLYDKISRVKRGEDVKNGEDMKNRRFVTPKRRPKLSNSACFPYGIGGNATGSIYGNYPESDNSSSTTNNPTAPLESSCAENFDDSIDIKMEMDRNSVSPQIPANRQGSPFRGNENEAEDLSISRKSEVRVIMPPSIAIKEAI